MNRGRLFRRRFESGLSTVQEKAEDLQGKIKDQASSLAEQTQYTLTQGKDTLMSWEHAAAHHIRMNRGLYLAGMVALTGLVLAKLIMDRFPKEENILD